MLNRIACSYFNSAGIGKDGELYLWGSPASGLFARASSKLEETPIKMPLKELNLNYKAVHVSMGPSHIAVIVENSFMDKVSIDKPTPTIYKSIARKHLNYYINNSIDVFKMTEISNSVIMTKKSFWEIIDEVKVVYTEEESYLLPHFVDSFEFNEHEPDKINFAQYLFSLNPDYFKARKVLIWGTKENGRLGLIDLNKKENADEKEDKENKKGANDEEDDEDDDDEEDVNLVLEDKLKGKDVDKIAKKKTIKSKNITNNTNLNKAEEFSENAILQMFDAKKNSFIDISHLILPAEIAKISCGHRFTIALSTDGEVFTWGKGSEGCLGTGNLKDSMGPVKIEEKHFVTGINNDYIVDIAAGAEHCLALTKKGFVFSWGNGWHGKLGHGSTVSKLFPSKIIFFVKKEISIISVVAGEQHSAAITIRDELFTWGCGANFRLGHGLNSNENEPKLVNTLADKFISKVSCGALHTLAITKLEGHLYAWGCGINGRLGIDVTSTADYIVPTRVGYTLSGFKNEKIVEISAGPFQSLALTETGDLYSWGATKFHTLGYRTLATQMTLPEKINQGNLKFYHNELQALNDELMSKKQKKLIDLKKNLELCYQTMEEFYPGNSTEFTIKIAAGGENTVFLTNNGTIYVCGSGKYGQLCIDPEKTLDKDEKLIKGIFKSDFTFYVDIPYLLPFSERIGFRYVACGTHHILGISYEGKVYGWGRNVEGQLGLGHTEKYVFEPTLLESFNKTEIIMVSCGVKFSAALSKDGDIYVFGTSDHGCLGSNPLKPTYDLLVPRLLTDIPQMKMISCGFEHMATISEDGTIYTWGNTAYGRLGHGKIEKCWVPKSITIQSPDENELAQFNLIAAGEMHTIALDTKGNVWGCGAKIYAGLPTSKTNKLIEEQSTFHLLPDLRKYKFKYIAANESHSLAVSEKGEVFGWGKSEYGKLGQESFINISEASNKVKNISLPRKIDQLKSMNIYSASCGANHSVVLTHKGTTYTWGCGLSGRLGIGSAQMKELAKANLLKKEFNVIVLSDPCQLNFIKTEPDSNRNRNSQIPETFSQAASMHMVNNNMSIGVGKDKYTESFLDFDVPTPGMRSNRPTLQKDARASKGNIAKDQGGISPTYSTRSNARKTKDSGFIDDKRDVSTLSVASINKRDKMSANVSFRKSKLPALEDIDGQGLEEGIIEKPNMSTMQDQKNKSNIVRNGSLNERVDPNTDGANGEDDDDVDGGTTLIKKGHPMFDNDPQMPLQRLLNTEDNSESENSLKYQDIQLENTLQSILEKVIKNAQQAKRKYIQSISLTENLIRTTLFINSYGSFIQHLPHHVPSFLLQNIQLYEGIISHLFIHPCYMKKLITSKLMDSTVALNLILKLYGTEKNNDRVANIVLGLAKMILKEEVPNYPINQASLFKMTSNVSKLYNYIMNIYSCNINFLKEILDYIINDVICTKLYEKLNANFEAAKKRCVEQTIRNMQDNDNESEDGKTMDEDDNKKLQTEEKAKKDVEAKANEEKEYILKTCLFFDRHNTQPLEIFRESDDDKVERLLEGLKLAIQQIIQKLNEPEFYLKKKVSKHIKYLNHKIIEEYKDFTRKEVKLEEGTGYSMFAHEDKLKRNVNIAEKKAEMLVIDMFFHSLPEMINQYKNFGIVVKNHKALHMLSQKNLHFFSNVLSKYFQKEIISLEPQFGKLNDFIFSQTKSKEMIDKFIIPLKNYEGYDLTIDNIAQIIRDAFNFQDTYISSLTVKDILQLQNFFASLGPEINQILLQDELTDPLKIMVDALVGEKYQIEIDAYPIELLQYKINLKLNIKLIEYIEKPEDIPEWENFDDLKKKALLSLHRCNQCNLLFPNRLLNKEDIIMINRTTWKCSLCRSESNPYTSLICLKGDCKGVIPKDDLQTVSTFKRYYPRIPKNETFLNYFRFLQSVDQIIEKDKKKSILPEMLETAKKDALNQQDLTKYVMIHEIMTFFEKFSLSTLLGEGIQDKICNGIEEKYMLIHEVFVEEFADRKKHRDYITSVQHALSEIDFFTKGASRKSETIIRDFEEANKRMVMKNCRDNGIILKLKKDEGDQEAAKIKIKNELQSKNFLPYAMYRSEDLIKSKTLKKFTLHDKEIKKIVTNLKYYFFTDEDENFFVKVVYLENSWLNLLFKCTPWCFINEVAIDEFEISKERFLEMRRTAHYKAEATFNYSTFYVGKLIEILDEILAKHLHNKIKKLNFSMEEPKEAQKQTV